MAEQQPLPDEQGDDGYEGELQLPRMGASVRAGTAERKQHFLTLLSEGCTVTQAAAGVGVHRLTAHRWRRDDPQFAAAWKEAEDVKLDALIAEAKRRALDGSDKLMMFMLSNLAPDQFRAPTQRMEVANPAGEKFEVSDAQAAARMAALFAAAQARAATDGSDLV